METTTDLDITIETAPAAHDPDCCVCIQRVQDPSWECAQCHSQCHLHCILQWVLRTVLNSNRGSTRCFTCPVCRFSHSVSSIQRGLQPDVAAAAATGGSVVNLFSRVFTVPPPPSTTQPAAESSGVVDAGGDDDDGEYDEEDDSERSLVTVKTRRLSITINAINLYNR